MTCAALPRYAVAVKHRHRGIGTGRDDVRTFVDFLRALTDLDVDIVLFPPFRGRSFRGFFWLGLKICRRFIGRNRRKGPGMLLWPPLPAPKPSMPTVAGIRVSPYISRPMPPVATHPHMLQDSVIDEGKRLAGLDGG